MPQKVKTKSKPTPALRKKPPALAKTPMWKLPGWILPALLLTVTVIAYSPVLKNDFINFDDSKLIYGNPVVNEGNAVTWERIWNYLHFTPHHKPLVVLFWNLEYRAVGKEAFLFHLNNLLLHLLNTLLLFFIIRRINRDFCIKEQYSGLVAFLIAFFFAVHPLHVESVAWATERKDMLYTFFFFSSLLAYQEYARKEGRYAWLAVSVVCYLLVILSKSMGITLFAVLFLIDFAARRKISARLFLEKVPHLIVLAYAIYNYGLLKDFTEHATGITAGVVDQGFTSYPDNFDSLSPLYIRLLLINIKTLLWVGHLLFPVTISSIYPQHTILQALGPSIHLFPVILLALLFLAFYYRKRHPWILFGLLFFLLTISPAIAIAERGVGIFMSDRYTYVPSIGILLVAVYFLYTVTLSRKEHPRMFLIPAVLIGILFIFSTFFVSRIWRNSETFWTRAIRVGGDEAAAAYNGRGRFYFENNDNDRALADFNKAIELDPKFGFAYYNRGKIYFQNGQFDLALKDYNVVLETSPRFLDALSNRGAILAKLGQREKALADLNLAIEINPNHETSLRNRGLLLFELKDYEGTLADHLKYLETIPGDHDIVNSVGVCYDRLGEPEKAVEMFTRAIGLYDKQGQYYKNRSICYKSMGKYDLALEDALTAKSLGIRIEDSYLQSLGNR
jgi:tetratricopeptide (TPR) repeat protein